MITRITPSRLSGEIRAISSKSDVHRIIICAALADRSTTIRNADICDDILATLSCVRSLGARTDVRDDCIIIHPAYGSVPEGALFDCAECGATLRFMLPVAVSRLNGSSAAFTGGGRLPERPISDLLACLGEAGAKFSSAALPFTASGVLSPGRFALPGHISSQFMSGLLLALPSLGGDSSVEMITPLESVSYVDMTIGTLKKFGVNASFDGSRAAIPGKQRFISPGDVMADGDWSNMACFLAAGAISGAMSVSGLNIQSRQGDKAILGIIERFGGAISLDGDIITVSGGALKATGVDCREQPDLAPVVAILACAAKGESRITGVNRLRFKESDRVASIVAMVNSLGGDARDDGDSIVINGGFALRGGEVDSWQDHRIVMAASILSALCRDDVVIDGSESVNKSYPRFFKDFAKAGGMAECRQ